jgi:hypothetical protein
MIITIRDRRNWNRVILQREGESVRAVIEQAVRDRVVLDWANLHTVDLTRAELTGGSFRGVVLESAVLHFARVDQCDFSGATLRSARCTGADFRRAKLIGTWLPACDLSDALLDEASIRPRDIRHASFLDSTLARASLVDLQESLCRCLRVIDGAGEAVMTALHDREQLGYTAVDPEWPSFVHTIARAADLPPEQIECAMPADALELVEIWFRGLHQVVGRWPNEVASVLSRLVWDLIKSGVLRDRAVSSSGGVE